MMRNLPQLASVVQRNCDISDARYAGDYGLCTFLLKMREYYRWENELPFARALPKDDLGDWLAAREQAWDCIEADRFAPLPLARGELEPFDAEAANRELLPLGCVYSAGYGRFGKPVFFLGRLLRVEQRAGYTILISSCEYARELAAPPAMLQGRTIFVRMESVRRYLWEKIEEWQWRKQGNTMARALASYDLIADTEAALARMADNEMETMILHELGEARAGELLGHAWREMMLSVAPAGTPGAISPGLDRLAGASIAEFGTVVPSGRTVSSDAALAVVARLAVQAPESSARGTSAEAFCQVFSRFCDMSPSPKSDPVWPSPRACLTSALPQGYA